MTPNEVARDVSRLSEKWFNFMNEPGTNRQQTDYEQFDLALYRAKLALRGDNYAAAERHLNAAKSIAPFPI